MNEREILEHAGIRGMKWGRRRWQNPDGTLTEAGKRRYGDGDSRRTKNKSTDQLKKENKRAEEVKKWNQLHPTKAESVKQMQIDNLNQHADLARGVSNTAREAATLGNNISRMAGPSKKVRQDIATMSDAELRQRINRQTMECQYASLNPSKVSRGAARAGDVLSIIGSLAAITAAGATTAIAIKQLKG